jgi:hypothetical protein
VLPGIVGRRQIVLWLLSELVRVESLERPRDNGRLQKRGPHVEAWLGLVLQLPAVGVHDLLLAFEEAGGICFFLLAVAVEIGTDGDNAAAESAGVVAAFERTGLVGLPHEVDRQPLLCEVSVFHI